MQILDIIRKKRDRQILSEDEIRFIIEEVTQGEVPEYQIGALLMAICLSGMTFDETRFLTDAMIGSGKVFDWQTIPGFKVDKHSTGGIGDKTSFIVAPLAASFGLKIPMISGRALGHTGGTIDKLESIQGIRTSFSVKECMNLVENVGLFIASQNDELVPADGILYSYRDITGTVESIPLIASSIMSKKIAEGLDGLVLDLKVGNGAFLKTLAAGKELADYMLEIGRQKGLKVTVVISDMNQPLGHLVGNAMEVLEASQVLNGEGPEDLRTLSVELTAQMLLQAGLYTDVDTAKQACFEKIESREAITKAAEMIRSQQGDPHALMDYYLLPQPQKEYIIRSTKNGYITQFHTESIGIAATLLGGGRLQRNDSIDHSVGIRVMKKIGGYVKAGEPLFTVSYNSEEHFLKATSMLEKSVLISENPEEPPSLIYEIITQG